MGVKCQIRVLILDCDHLMRWKPSLWIFLWPRYVGSRRMSLASPAMRFRFRFRWCVGVGFELDVEVLVRCSHNLLTFCSGEMHDAACGRSDREGGDARLAAGGPKHTFCP